MTEVLSNTPDGTNERQMELETIFSKNVYKIKWRVTNFALCQYKVGECLESNIFTTNFGKNRKEWNLQMYPSGYNSGAAGYVSVYLNCNSQCTACYELYLLNDRNQPECKATVTDYPFAHTSGWWTSKFVKRDQLFEENSRLLVNGAMIIMCVIRLTEMENVKHPRPVSVARSTLRLTKDLGDLLKSSKLSDVTINAGGRTFQAHRAVLAARSPVFSAMFEHRMTETTSGVIEIPDVTAQAMEALLNFVYTGECNDVGSVAQDLFQISEKYQLEELKKYCSDDLFDQITVENAASILVLADFCNAQDLKDNVLEFITTNMEAFMISEDWKKMIVSNPRLTIDVQSKIIERI